VRFFLDAPARHDTEAYQACRDGRDVPDAVTPKTHRAEVSCRPRNVKSQEGEREGGGEKGRPNRSVTARGRARPRSRRVKSSSVFNRSHGRFASRSDYRGVFAPHARFRPDICPPPTPAPSPDRSGRAFLRARNARGRSRAGSSSSSRRLSRRERQTIGETNVVGDCEIYRTPRSDRGRLRYRGGVS